MVSRADVVAAARGHIDTPWQHQGRLVGVALDCAGLVIVAARQLQLVPADFDINGYSRQPDGTLLAVCDAHMQRIDRLELGCVLVIAIRADPQHLGIVGNYRHGGFSLIHAHSGVGRVIETRLMPMENLTVLRIYRIPGVSE